MVTPLDITDIYHTIWSYGSFNTCKMTVGTVDQKVWNWKHCEQSHRSMVGCQEKRKNKTEPFTGLWDYVGNNGFLCLIHLIVSAKGWEIPREKGYKWEEHNREREGATQPARDKPGPLWEINAGI